MNKGQANMEEIKEKDEVKKNKKGPIAIIGSIIEAVIWICMVFFLVVLVATTLSNETEIFGYRVYIIMSGSMEPTIKIKDAIITKKTDDVKVGDVIAFNDGYNTTVHRIVKEYNKDNEKLYETKGDANNTVDKQLVKDSMIQGKVKYVIPVLGEVIFFLQGHLFLLVLMIGALIIVIIVRRIVFNE